MHAAVALQLAAAAPRWAPPATAPSSSSNTAAKREAAADRWRLQVQGLQGWKGEGHCWVWAWEAAAPRAPCAGDKRALPACRNGSLPWLLAVNAGLCCSGTRLEEHVG